MSKDWNTTPDRLALCIMLARGDHMAGVLLHKIVHWSKYGKAEIPQVEGCWYARERGWWTREAQLSPRQYDRAIATLAGHDLIEKRQWWFGRRNILHVRPTELTTDFLHAATTWDAAHEILNYPRYCAADEAQSGVAELGKPTSPISAMSNGIAELGNPSSPEAVISKHVIDKQHSYGMKEDIQTIAHPAPPSCVTASDNFGEDDGKDRGKNEKGGKHAKKKSPSATAPTSSAGKYEVPSLYELAETWQTSVAALHPHGVKTPSGPAKLASKEIGKLALIRKNMGEIDDNHGGVFVLTALTANMIAITVKNWEKLFNFCGAYGFKNAAHPQIEYLYEHFGPAVSFWIEAEYPSAASVLKSK